jgi:CCR4-NOT transcriptional regulation complex NOT5 subunit
MKRPEFYSDLHLTMVGIEPTLEHAAWHIEHLQAYIKHLESNQTISPENINPKLG